MNRIQARNRALSIGLILAALLTACGPSPAELTPTVDPNAIRTQAVATFAVGLTNTALAAPTHTPTPSPSPTPSPTPRGSATAGTPVQANLTCYKLLYVSDVTIPDNTVVTPGQKFTKTWRAQNTGSCAWAPGFKFSLVGGDAMAGQTLVLSTAVPVGASYDLSIEMTVPSNKSGKIDGTWRMQDANGVYFGDPLTVVVQVGGATAAATQQVTETATTETPED